MSGDPRETDRSAFRQIGILSGVGITLVVSTVLGLAGGYALDRWLGTSPWFTLIGLLLGIASGFVSLFRAVGQADRDEGGQTRDPGGEAGR